MFVVVVVEEEVEEEAEVVVVVAVGVVVVVVVVVAVVVILVVVVAAAAVVVVLVVVVVVVVLPSDSRTSVDVRQSPNQTIGPAITVDSRLSQKMFGPRPQATSMMLYRPLRAKHTESKHLRVQQELSEQRTSYASCAHDSQARSTTQKPHAKTHL